MVCWSNIYSASNIEIIQHFQKKVLKYIVNAPWYLRNNDLYRDLGVKMIADELKKFTRSMKNHIKNPAA